VSVAAALSRTAETFDEPATAIDGRLMPHEWVRLDDGSSWIKTDALDHHCDHFLPGCTDAAWDVAGAIVELSLDERGQLAFVNEYVRRSGDGSITHRLPFYLAAYCAFRTGYCRIAAQTLRGTADGQRFEQLEAGYRTRLRATLAPNVRRTPESAGGSR
jgi:hypothetical protein